MTEQIDTLHQPDVVCKEFFFCFFFFVQSIKSLLVFTITRSRNQSTKLFKHLKIASLIVYKTFKKKSMTEMPSQKIIFLCSCSFFLINLTTTAILLLFLFANLNSTRQKLFFTRFLLQSISCNGLECLFDINRFFCTCLKVWDVSFFVAPLFTFFLRNLDEFSRQMPSSNCKQQNKQCLLLFG